MPIIEEKKQEERQPSQPSKFNFHERKVSSLQTEIIIPSRKTYMPNFAEMDLAKFGESFPDPKDFCIGVVILDFAP